MIGMTKLPELSFCIKLDPVNPAFFDPERFMTNSKSNFQPTEMSNARTTKIVSMPVLPFALLRYETIADFYTQEPRVIHIKLQEDILDTEDNELNTFEQIFRLRFWIPNEKSYSWCIYSNNRDWRESSKTNLIIRHAIWQRRYDMKKCMEYRKKYKPSLQDRVKDLQDPLYDWPNIELRNIYLKPEPSWIKTLLDIDNILLNGASLSQRNNQKMPEWCDVEVMRLFDWGTIHLLWDPHRQNQQLESSIYELEEKLIRSVKINGFDIYQMILDYSLPPHLLKLSREHDLSELAIPIKNIGLNPN